MFQANTPYKAQLADAAGKLGEYPAYRGYNPFEELAGAPLVQTLLHTFENLQGLASFFGGRQISCRKLETAERYTDHRDWPRDLRHSWRLLGTGN